VQFSVDYDDNTQHTSVPEIAAAMQGVAAHARTGCLIYFTSHGTPDGIVIGDTILGPAQMHDMVNSACGTRPSVIVMSSCYSGQFVAALQGDSRVVMTAARPDRTSFGCGELGRRFSRSGRIGAAMRGGARAADEGDAAVRAAARRRAQGDLQPALARCARSAARQSADMNTTGAARSAGSIKKDFGGRP
jgi:hypothetical protein